MVSSCPKECRCIGTRRVSVYCDYKGLVKVPEHIPVETTHLYLNGNKFKKLLPEMLQGQVLGREGQWTDERIPLPELRVVRVDANPIELVNEHAFNSVPGVETIYLPYGVKIQREVLGQLRVDKETFDGFYRVPVHPLEDPNFVAFSIFNSTNEE